MGSLSQMVEHARRIDLIDGRRAEEAEDRHAWQRFMSAVSAGSDRHPWMDAERADEMLKQYRSRFPHRFTKED